MLSLHPPDQYTPLQLSRVTTVPLDDNKLFIGVTAPKAGNWTLRVLINGASRGDVRVDGSRWYDACYDLSEFAGQSVRIDVQTHPHDWYQDWAYFDYIAFDNGQRGFGHLVGKKIEEANADYSWKAIGTLHKTPPEKKEPEPIKKIEIATADEIDRQWNSDSNLDGTSDGGLQGVFLTTLGSIKESRDTQVSDRYRIGLIERLEAMAADSDNGDLVRGALMGNAVRLAGEIETTYGFGRLVSAEVNTPDVHRVGLDGAMRLYRDSDQGESLSSGMRYLENLRNATLRSSRTVVLVGVNLNVEAVGLLSTRLETDGRLNSTQISELRQFPEWSTNWMVRIIETDQFSTPLYVQRDHRTLGIELYNLNRRVLAKLKSDNLYSSSSLKTFEGNCTFFAALEQLDRMKQNSSSPQGRTMYQACIAVVHEDYNEALRQMQAAGGEYKTIASTIGNPQENYEALMECVVNLEQLRSKLKFRNCGEATEVVQRGFQAVIKDTFRRIVEQTRNLEHSTKLENQIIIGKRNKLLKECGLDVGEVGVARDLRLSLDEKTSSDQAGLLQNELRTYPRTPSMSYGDSISSNFDKRDQENTPREVPMIDRKPKRAPPTLN